MAKFYRPSSKMFGITDEYLNLDLVTSVRKHASRDVSFLLSDGSGYLWEFHSEEDRDKEFERLVNPEPKRDRWDFFEYSANDEFQLIDLSKVMHVEADFDSHTISFHLVGEVELDWRYPDKKPCLKDFEAIKNILMEPTGEIDNG